MRIWYVTSRQIEFMCMCVLTAERHYPLMFLASCFYCIYYTISYSWSLRGVYDVNIVRLALEQIFHLCALTYRSEGCLEVWIDLY